MHSPLILFRRSRKTQFTNTTDRNEFEVGNSDICIIDFLSTLYPSHTVILSLLSVLMPSSSWCWASFLDGPEGPSFDSGLSSDWIRGTDELGISVVGQGSRGRQITVPPLTRVSPAATFNDEDGRYIYDAGLLHEIWEENEICIDSARTSKV